MIVVSFGASEISQFWRLSFHDLGLFLRLTINNMQFN